MIVTPEKKNTKDRMLLLRYDCREHLTYHLVPQKDIMSYIFDLLKIDLGELEVVDVLNMADILQQNDIYFEIINPWQGREIFGQQQTTKGE